MSLVVRLVRAHMNESWLGWFANTLMSLVVRLVLAHMNEPWLGWFANTQAVWLDSSNSGVIKNIPEGSRSEHFRNVQELFRKSSQSFLCKIPYIASILVL